MFGVPATAGEQLRAYLGRDLLAQIDWDGLATSLIVTSRAEAYTDYIRRFTATHLASRLILSQDAPCNANFLGGYRFKCRCRLPGMW